MSYGKACFDKLGCIEKLHPCTGIQLLPANGNNLAPIY